MMDDGHSIIRYKMMDDGHSIIRYKIQDDGLWAEQDKIRYKMIDQNQREVSLQTSCLKRSYISLDLGGKKLSIFCSVGTTFSYSKSFYKIELFR